MCAATPVKIRVMVVVLETPQTSVLFRRVVATSSDVVGDDHPAGLAAGDNFCEGGGGLVHAARRGVSMFDGWVSSSAVRRAS
jgi:hypothetical protein